MYQISSLTTIFVFVAGAIGFWAHGRHCKIEKKLVLVTGSCAAIVVLALSRRCAGRRHSAILPAAHCDVNNIRCAAISYGRSDALAC
uniref:hypothetical protein n=1 Tax=Dissulfurimicrobium sp. TaxID=2022436 RepID=UPI00404A1956